VIIDREAFNFRAFYWSGMGKHIKDHLIGWGISSSLKVERDWGFSFQN